MDGGVDQLNRELVLPGLLGYDTRKVQRIRASGRRFEDLAIAQLGFGRAPLTARRA